MYGVCFVAEPGMLALPHWEPASAGTPRESYGIQNSDKGNELYVQRVSIILTVYEGKQASQFLSSTTSCSGTAAAQWIRFCATNRKVAVSIPDGVVGFFR
jgi:hypothetical protein